MKRVKQVKGRGQKSVRASTSLSLRSARTGKPHLATTNWHATATGGAFSATAAAAKLWGLTAEHLQMAWGIAASRHRSVAGVGAHPQLRHDDGAFPRRQRRARRRHVGLVALTLPFPARGERGFICSPFEKVLATLGKPWAMEEPGIFVKRWPCCYCNHRPLAGMIRLIREHGIRADEVTNVDVGFLPGADTALVSFNPVTGSKGNSASSTTPRRSYSTAR